MSTNTVHACVTFSTGDDQNIVTSTRGGPGKFQVTGWMQIENLLKRHEGDYTCIAVNEQGKSEAKARIKVIERKW